uniref:Uncharacterized protein n=1 Tax=Timema tahoe TaxID=61484 RepID=A0A7R9NVS2_9NEOP|nr:unnamed protein product [Timema tahoe]
MSTALYYLFKLDAYTSVLSFVVLTDSSQLTSDGFEKLPDQIIVPVTNVKLALSCSEEGDLCYRQLLLQYVSGEWLPVDSVPSDTTAIMVGE